jgi:mercuric ion transport protein
MKTAFGAVGAAVAASACCITPVLFSLLGAGALGASAIKLEAYRPWLLGLTALLLGVAFVNAYRPVAVDTCQDGTCAPRSKRAGKILVWIAAVIVTLLAAFPYYISYLL